MVGQATANLFPLFGASPARGRLLTAEDMTGGAPVAVLAHDFWARQFGGEESVLGRTIQLDDASYEVVGVAPAGFRLTHPEPRPFPLNTFALRVHDRQRNAAIPAAEPNRKGCRIGNGQRHQE